MIYWTNVYESVGQRFKSSRAHLSFHALNSSPKTSLSVVIARGLRLVILPSQGKGATGLVVLARKKASLLVLTPGIGYKALDTTTQEISMTEPGIFETIYSTRKSLAEVMHGDRWGQ